jgi:hypothetical protein
MFCIRATFLQDESPSRAESAILDASPAAVIARSPDGHSGVVDQFCRSFAVPNLYITDGSVLPTQGAANPALTIMAVAARAAGHLTAQAGR